MQSIKYLPESDVSAMNVFVAPAIISAKVFTSQVGFEPKCLQNTARMTYITQHFLDYSHCLEGS